MVYTAEELEIHCVHVESQSPIVVELLMIKAFIAEVLEMHSVYATRKSQCVVVSWTHPENTAEEPVLEFVGVVESKRIAPG